MLGLPDLSQLLNHEPTPQEQAAQAARHLTDYLAATGISARQFAARAGIKRPRFTQLTQGHAATASEAQKIHTAMGAWDAERRTKRGLPLTDPDD